MVVKNKTIIFNPGLSKADREFGDRCMDYCGIRKPTSSPASLLGKPKLNISKRIVELAKPVARNQKPLVRKSTPEKKIVESPTKVQVEEKKQQNICPWFEGDRITWFNSSSFDDILNAKLKANPTYSINDLDPEVEAFKIETDKMYNSLYPTNDTTLKDSSINSSYTCYDHIHDSTETTVMSSCEHSVNSTTEQSDEELDEAIDKPKDKTNKADSADMLDRLVGEMRSMIDEITEECDDAWTTNN